MKDAALGALLKEADSLRFAVSLPDTDDLGTLDKAFIKARGNLDRLETIYGQLIDLKGGADQALADARAAKDDKWRETASDPKKAFGQREPAPRERYAHYDLSALNELLKLRHVERVRSEIETVHEILKLYYYGLKSLLDAIQTRVGTVSAYAKLGEHVRSNRDD